MKKKAAPKKTKKFSELEAKMSPESRARSNRKFWDNVEKILTQPLEFGDLRLPEPCPDEAAILAAELLKIATAYDNLKFQIRMTLDWVHGRHRPIDPSRALCENQLCKKLWGLLETTG